MKYILFFLSFILFIGCSDNSDSDTQQSSTSRVNTIQQEAQDDTTDNKIIEDEKYGKIARFSEASGICYVNKTNTLFVACDDGHLYEISKNGKVLNSKDLSTIKNNDFEGITYDATHDLILVAVEGSDDVLVLDKQLNIQHTIDIKRTSQGRLILEKDKKHGLEAITTDSGKIFLSNQSFTALDEEEDNPSVVFSIDLLEASKTTKDIKANIGKIFDHGYVDISGMHMYNNYLYMVSDADNLLIKYDLLKNKVIQESSIISFGSELEDAAIEGIAFDDKNNIYFTDDKDGHIFKYKFSE